MALLHKTIFSKPDGVAGLPPSLASGSYTAKIKAELESRVALETSNTTTVIFNDASDMTSYMNAIALTAEEQSQLNAWKTANNITITYELYDLTASGTTPPAPFGN